MKDEYLVVADYDQHNIYQLKPESGEVRAIAMSACQPVSVVVDASINGLYVICHEVPNSINEHHYRIRKKTLDMHAVDRVIYNAGKYSQCQTLELSTTLSSD